MSSEPAARSTGLHGLSNASAGVLAHLRQLDREVTVVELADLLGQHRNTVRAHLDDLVAAGQVTVRSAPPQGRGRPALLYRVDPRTMAGERDYADLAAALAQTLVLLDPSPEAAREVGENWAKRVVAAQPARTGRADLVDTLRELGFEPSPGSHEAEIRLRRCPLHLMMDEHSATVCPMHETMIAEVLTARGFGADEWELVRHGRSCSIRLNPAQMEA